VQAVIAANSILALEVSVSPRLALKLMNYQCLLCPIVVIRITLVRLGNDLVSPGGDLEGQHCSGRAQS
jgi:hypothetical protein